MISEIPAVVSDIPQTWYDDLKKWVIQFHGGKSPLKLRAGGKTIVDRGDPKAAEWPLYFIPTVETKRDNQWFPMAIAGFVWFKTEEDRDAVLKKIQDIFEETAKQTSIPQTK